MNAAPDTLRGVQRLTKRIAVTLDGANDLTVLRFTEDQAAAIDAECDAAGYARATWIREVCLVAAGMPPSRARTCEDARDRMERAADAAGMPLAAWVRLTVLAGLGLVEPINGPAAVGAVKRLRRGE